MRFHPSNPPEFDNFKHNPLLMRPLLLAAFMTIAFGACHKNDDKPAAPLVNATLTSGTWRVSYFLKSNEDKTDDLTGFSFVFSSNGTVSATKDGLASSGSWSSSYPAGSYEPALVLAFSSPEHLAQLSRQWDVNARLDDEIGLIVINDQSMMLTFKKN